MNLPPTLTEQQIRELRDKVYGHATTDLNWNNCRENWEHDLDWLTEAAAGRVPIEERALSDVPKKEVREVRRRG